MKSVPSVEVPRRPGETYPRLSIELVTAEEQQLSREALAAAALQGRARREWVLEAMREKLERDRTKKEGRERG